MKKILCILTLSLGIMAGYSQEEPLFHYPKRYTTESNNVVQVTYNLDKGKSSSAGPSYKNTGETAMYNGKIHPVYLSERGKLFIFVISKKTGNKYKKYIN